MGSGCGGWGGGIVISYTGNLILPLNLLFLQLYWLGLGVGFVGQWEREGRVRGSEGKRREGSWVKGKEEGGFVGQG